MNKRGQIYLLAMIILAVVFYTLYNIENKVEQEKLEDNFEKLAQNYDTESSKIINALLNSNIDIFEGFSNFTVLFTSYSKSQNLDFGLIYAFNNQDQIQVGNFLNKAIIIDHGSFEELEGCLDKTPATITFQGLTLTTDLDLTEIEQCITEPFSYVPKIWIQIGDLWYPFQINKDKPQIAIVSNEEAVEQRKVYIGGEGFVEENPEKETEIICRNYETQEECLQYTECKWQNDKCKKG